MFVCVCDCFSGCGWMLEEMFGEICDGVFVVDDLLMIVVVMYDVEWVSDDVSDVSDDDGLGG